MTTDNTIYQPEPGATEQDIARDVATGRAPSGFSLGDSSLFALRISGSGLAYRAAHDEHVYRAPEIVTDPAFLTRCNGLSVTLGHPPGNVLTSAEFADRSIGSVILPYRANEDGLDDSQGAECWGVARIFNDLASDLMRRSRTSTSPSVIFGSDDGNEVVKAGEDGQRTFLIEGKPSRLDHIAVLPAGRGGVWDKGGPPSGVRADSISTSKDDTSMSGTTETGGDDNAFGQLMSVLEKINTRLDALETAATPAPAAAAAVPEVEADAATPPKPKDESEADPAEMADIQARADQVNTALGQETPRFMPGEKALDYRRRLARRFQKHSTAWKGVNLSTVPAEVVPIAETQIYADAMAAAMNPLSTAEGQLREIRKADSTGRLVSTFVGRPNDWMRDFKSPKRRLFKINKTEHNG